jgi:hypothetical protein
MRLGFLLLLAACESQYVFEEDEDIVGEDTLPEEDTAVEEDYSEYDGATLQIVTPASGDFLAYGEPHTFEAKVIGADGQELPFEDIAWSSDEDDAWALLGANLEDDSLDVGTHALTAVAALPNGDRLAYTIGGVLVQSAYTGVYTGEIAVNLAVEYDGTSYAAGCGGAITLVVDAYGEMVEGDAGCLLSLLGYELDTAYIFELENDEGELTGTAALDLSFYQLDIEASGEIDDDGNLTMSFADDIYGLGDLDGSVEAARVSRDISQYE